MPSKRRPAAKKRSSKPAWRRVKRARRSAKVSSAAARRQLDAAIVSAAVAKALRGGMTKPIEPPPQAVAQMGALVAAFVAGVKKGFACAANQATIDAVNNALDAGGSTYSEQDKADLRKLGDEAWNNMVELGCGT